ncbi:enoyl-CoA hydratase/isomerase family protein [Amycolatopsis sp. K13G38]|uniref:3-hydroxyisobutyryl-CoA hydrolase n=2 Tax=Amycolatopsis acididurans TaxID=2724524 RepID=A0ABX1JBM9_9PSEU|nr:enoyl-CoA hydratase/isomerase family protein [Amycolatopsis acididurans]
MVVRGEQEPAGNSSGAAAPVLARREGVLGRLTLNRPRALNALDLRMMQAMLAALDAWEDDPRVRAVLLDAVGDRAFCAGGDLGVVYRSAGGDAALARRLWREEYRLDARLARYPKPVVTIMDGITMGGGVGIGCHAAVRIVSERVVVAMPEVAIGLAPDVGGTLLLSGAPGETGAHLALTGDRIGPDDAVYCGLADHIADPTRLPGLVADLAAGGQIEATVAQYARPALPGRLAASREWVDACYGGDVEAVVRRLAARPEEAARAAAARIKAASPTAVKVTAVAMGTARSMTGIEECLRQDYRLCSRFLAHPDLAEGIRAAIIDKDRRPLWVPPDLAAVADADVAGFFAPLADDLVLT